MHWGIDAFPVIAINGEAAPLPWVSQTRRALFAYRELPQKVLFMNAFDSY